MEKIICGVDISRDHLDAGIRPGGHYQRFANSPEGIAELYAFCLAHKVELLAMEASGGYERLAFLMLWQNGLACALLNPRQVRRFAEAMGYLEKTDQIDCLVIAHFAQVKRAKPTPPPSAAQSRLRALVNRLGQITQDLVVNRHRFSATADAEAQASIAAVLSVLRSQSRGIEAKIMAAIADDPLWAKLDEACREVKGVAGRTIARLLAELPELGVYDNKAVAKLTGLAPLANDSGKRSGPRAIRGGRAPVRSILFLAADIARRYHKGLNAFYDRLKTAGKAKMAIRIALARKLLVILNAKARDARAAFANTP